MLFRSFVELDDVLELEFTSVFFLDGLVVTTNERGRIRILVLLIKVTLNYKAFGKINFFDATWFKEWYWISFYA